MKILLVIAHFAGDENKLPEDDWRYNRYGILDGQQYTHELELNIVLSGYESFGVPIDVVINTTKNLQITGYHNLNITYDIHSTSFGWELGIDCRRIIIENKDNYDYFIYSENDLMLSKETFDTYLSQLQKLKINELPGLLRFEYNNGVKQLIDLHDHWKHNYGISGEVQKNKFHIRNLHQGLYILDKPRLERAIKSGGFDTTFVWNSAGWDKMVRCVTDLFTKCNFSRIFLIPEYEKLLIWHVSQNYCTREEAPWNDLLTVEEFKQHINEKSNTK
ncbi:MAG: hypothetical protein KDH96_09670 [Candidatus Riesia sp.]|nr:hypothetical protein [Candidatus Riesia sp.]